MKLINKEGLNAQTAFFHFQLPVVLVFFFFFKAAIGYDAKVGGGTMSGHYCQWSLPTEHPTHSSVKYKTSSPYLYFFFFHCIRVFSLELPLLIQIKWHCAALCENVILLLYY